MDQMSDAVNDSASSVHKTLLTTKILIGCMPKLKNRDIPDVTTFLVKGSIVKTF